MTGGKQALGLLPVEGLWARRSGVGSLREGLALQPEVPGGPPGPPLGPWSPRPLPTLSLTGRPVQLRRLGTALGPSAVRAVAHPRRHLPRAQLHPRDED